MLDIKKLFTKILTSLSNKVDRTDDTMTAIYTLKSTNIDYSNPPSSEVRGNAYIRYRDNEDNEIGRLGPSINAAGTHNFYIQAIRYINGTRVRHQLVLMIDSAGNRTISISDPAAWRNGLGLSNYDNTWISTSAIANIITANTTNATIDSAYYAQSGHMAMLYIQWKNKAAITIATSGVVTNTVVGTLVSGKRPRALCNAFGRESNGLTYSINASGVVTLLSGNGGAAAKTIAANTVNNLYVCYIV